ncbi:MAG: DUF262 domain-containing protein [Bacteroidales bacterium]|nr:DUF262 domain-containing protein [Bacteroidales bacterium]
MNNKTTFWNYIKNNVIEIPIIQRDYAQGRLGKENLRKNFLTDLKKALDQDSPCENTAMKLDFVYGSTENNKMNPLDGQQRLTTLWLLHWYIALRAGVLNKDNCTILQKFTYETRISSREFCQNLCIPENFENFAGNDIVGFITKQTWFYSAWKQDPTIQSMLRMLGGTKVADIKGEDIDDGIEEIFTCPSKCDIDGNGMCALRRIFERYWERLISENAPIVFYHIPLQDFGLSDDLYIKMNARGKQLTSFENFKADLIGYITKQSEDETLDENIRAEWKKLLDPEIGIPIKLDTDWTDIFWRNKSNDNQIDEIYFAFLNRFFWNELFIAKDKADKYILDIGKGDENSTQENNNSSYKYLNNSDHPNDYDTTIAYEGLDSYKYYKGTIPLSFFQKLAKVLNEYLKYSENNTLPNCSWDTSFRFIPQYVVENSNNIEISNNANEKILKFTTLNQVQRIVFFAVSKYFSDSGANQSNEVSLKQWMRVVWNLVSGEDHNGRPQIRSTQAMRTAMKFISELNSHDVYSSLSNYELQKLGNSDFDERCKEEIAKAKQILDENSGLRECNGFSKKEDGSDYHTWEELIIDAEKYAFFKGGIRFLFLNELRKPKWDDFYKKINNAKKYFNDSGVIEKYKVPITKALIKQCAQWGSQVLNKQIFNTNSNTWSWILVDSLYCQAIHKILMADDLDSIPTLYFDDANINEFIKKESLPYNEMVIKNPMGRFRFKHGIRLGYYKPYGQDAIAFDWSDYYRNAVLTELCERKSISTSQRIDETCFYNGWDVDFEYNKHVFQWNFDNYVYLMNNGVYCKKDFEANLDEEKYFRFKVTQKDIDVFLNELEKLIFQYDNNSNSLDNNE